MNHYEIVSKNDINLWKNIEYQTTTTKMPHINHGGAFVVFLKLLIMTHVNLI